MKSGFLDIANAIKLIGQTYISETSDADGKKTRRLPATTPQSVSALEGVLANWLRSLVAGRSSTYLVKASAGQVNRSFAFIPYATILRQDVTISPTKGVYIVLLFSQDMNSLWISLNQGVGLFHERFREDPRRALAQSAHLLAGSLDVPVGFTAGPIQLSATGDFGMGYEAAAILSKQYPLDGLNLHSVSDLAEDLMRLISVYESIDSFIAADPSIVLLSDEVYDDEEEFQTQANSDASKTTLIPPDKHELPSKLKVRGKEKLSYVRKPGVAGIAILASNFRCEVSPDHVTFTSAATKRAYLEAHHLIPFSRQSDFPTASLDVQANVVALCPNCHAMIHRATSVERRVLVASLFAAREARLAFVGVTIDLQKLIRMYR